MWFGNRSVSNLESMELFLPPPEITVNWMNVSLKVVCVLRDTMSSFNGAIDPRLARPRQPSPVPCSADRQRWKWWVVIVDSRCNSAPYVERVSSVRPGLGIEAAAVVGYAMTRRSWPRRRGDHNLRGANARVVTDRSRVKVVRDEDSRDPKIKNPHSHCEYHIDHGDRCQPKLTEHTLSTSLSLFPFPLQ